MFRHGGFSVWIPLWKATSKYRKILVNRVKHAHIKLPPVPGGKQVLPVLIIVKGNHCLVTVNLTKNGI